MYELFSFLEVISCSLYHLNTAIKKYIAGNYFGMSVNDALPIWLSLAVLATSFSFLFCIGFVKVSFVLNFVFVF